MSLLRQLLIIISLLILVAFAGTLLISVNNMRLYLEEQMESHAQDTATSLALSITPHVEKGDWPVVTSMADAIFDRGYYRELLIISTDGRVLLERRLPVRVETVPQWFVASIPLDTPAGEAIVSGGWRQAGRIVVRSHPGYAYNELWRSAVVTLLWFAVSWAVATMAVVVVLRVVLKPLKEVEGQAIAISDREFPVLERIPRTRELKTVVTAMNKMSTKLKRYISDQVELIERIREEAHRDPVTGLANRRYFDARLRHLLGSSEEFPRGALVLVQLAGFKEYNDRHGLQKGDELLRETASILMGTFADAGKAVMARLSGADFAVLTQVTSRDEAGALGESVCAAIAGLRARGLSDGLCVGHAGVAYYDSARDSSDLFSEADMALRAAQIKGPNAWHMYDKTVLEPWEIRSAARWQERLRKAIAERDITLFFQPVVRAADGTLMHHEALARIPAENGSWLPASFFMPMAEKLGLASEFDRVVVEKVISHSGRTESSEPVAINISPASVKDLAFAGWLTGELGRSKGLAARLIFESAEYGCAADTAALRRFVESVRKAGSKFSLDHFGVGFSPFGYLRDLKLDYIKIDGSHIRRINEEKDSQFFVRALTEIAHGLEFAVIAEAVENDLAMETIRGLNVDGAQGYLVGEPRMMG